MIFEGRLLSELRYIGICRSDSSYWASMDETAFIDGELKTGKAKFINAKMQFSNIPEDRLIKDKDLEVESFTLDDVINVSKQAVIKTIELILKNDFSIAPSSMDVTKPVKIDNLWCKYCDHQDICYVNKVKDAKDYSEYIKSVIRNKGVN